MLHTIFCHVQVKPAAQSVSFLMLATLDIKDTDKAHFGPEVWMVY